MEQPKEQKKLNIQEPRRPNPRPQSNWAMGWEDSVKDEDQYPPKRPVQNQNYQKNTYHQSKKLK